jgi:hypothetical protein
MPIIDAAKPDKGYRQRRCLQTEKSEVISDARNDFLSAENSGGKLLAFDSNP